VIISLYRMVLLLLILSPPIQAGEIYRCEDADGVPQFVQKKIPSASCKTVSYNHQKSSFTAPKPATAEAAAQTAAAKTAGEAKFLRMGYSTSYVWVDADGVKHFASTRPKGVANVQVKRTEYPIFSIAACYACSAGTTVNFGSVRLNTQAYAAEIRAASQRYGVEEAVVRAIIHAESAYRPHVVSPKNAQGLMQLIPATAKRFGVRDAFNPAQNIDGGVQYLAFLLKRYQNDLTLAAAAYNAGEGAVDRFKGVPPYKETRNYVVRVGQLADRYRKAMKSG
jgi:soluble lytic murein transglycosylase-like protein